MTKSELWKEVQKLLKEAKVKDITKFEELLAPKSRKSDYIEPKDGKHYCRKFKMYLPKSEFPQTELKYEETKRAQPACKLALKIIKTNRTLINEKKGLINEIMGKVLDGEITIEEGKQLRSKYQGEIDKLELFLKNDFTSLDYEKEYKKFFK